MNKQTLGILLITPLAFCLISALIYWTLHAFWDGNPVFMGPLMMVSAMVGGFLVASSTGETNE